MLLIIRRQTIFLTVNGKLDEAGNAHREAEGSQPEQPIKHSFQMRSEQTHRLMVGLLHPLGGYIVKQDAEQNCAARPIKDVYAHMSRKRATGSSLIPRKSLRNRGGSTNEPVAKLIRRSTTR
jgi:hypothetical protein